MLSLVRDLPKGSRYVTLLRWRRANGEDAGDRDDEQPSEERREAEERHELRVWSDLDSELAALQVNILNDLLRYVPQWKKTPEAAEPVGPPHWRKTQQQESKGATSAPRSERGPATVLDAMKAMGYDSGH